MSLVTIVGIGFCWSDRAIRYLFLSGLVMLMFYVEFLPAYAASFYDYQSLLILLSVGIVYKLVDKLSPARHGFAVVRRDRATYDFRSDDQRFCFVHLPSFPDRPGSFLRKSNGDLSNRLSRSSLVRC